MFRIILTAIIFFFVTRWLSRLFPGRPAPSTRGSSGDGRVHGSTGPRSTGPRSTGPNASSAGAPAGGRHTRGAVDAEFEDITDH